MRHPNWGSLLSCTVDTPAWPDMGDFNPTSDDECEPAAYNRMVTSHQGDQAEPDDDVSASAHTENVASNVNDRPEPEHAEATTSEGTPPPDSVPDGDGASWKDQTLRESWLKVAEERIKQVSDPKSAYRHGADLLDGSPTNTFVLVIFGVSLGWLSLKYALSPLGLAPEDLGADPFSFGLVLIRPGVLAIALISAASLGSSIFWSMLSAVVLFMPKLGLFNRMQEWRLESVMRFDRFLSLISQVFSTYSALLFQAAFIGTISFGFVLVHVDPRNEMRGTKSEVPLLLLSAGAALATTAVFSRFFSVWSRHSLALLICGVFAFTAGVGRLQVEGVAAGGASPIDSPGMFLGSFMKFAQFPFREVLITYPGISSDAPDGLPTGRGSIPLVGPDGVVPKTNPEPPSWLAIGKCVVSIASSDSYHLVALTRELTVPTEVVVATLPADQVAMSSCADG